MAIRVVTGPDYIELQRSGTHHHVQLTDKKKLTIEQALAVQDAARSAPGVSAAQLRRNLRTHDSPTKNIGPEHARQIQRLVYQERKKVQQKMLGGAVVDDNFGSLTTFADDNRWAELVRKHNDAEDSYRLKLFEAVIIGSNLQAARGIVRLNFSSLWMLLNAFRSIKSGWLFQLNGDVTGKVCRADIDLLEFSVTSMPRQNNILCISTIPNKTESQTTYTITWEDLRKAACLVPTIVHCGAADCECCESVFELLRDPDVIKFMASARFQDQQLPVDTAMCDNFLGWGNFAECLGIPTNVCMQHATGKCRSILNLIFHTDSVHDRDRCRQSIASQVLPGHGRIRRLLRLARRTEPHCSGEFR
jgi:hypothetical protein